MINRLNEIENWFVTKCVPRLDNITWQFPLTLLSIPFIIRDWHTIILVPVLAVIDLSIYNLIALFINYRNNRIIIKDAKDKCLSGNLAVYDSQLVDQFRGVVIKERPPFLDVLKKEKEIIVLLSDKSDASGNNYSSFSEESIIVLNNRFNENEKKNVYLLAHEFGHIYHVYKRAEMYSLPVYITIIQILLLIHAIYFGTWLYFFLLLPINTVLFIKYSSSFKSFSETDADLAALHIIESVWGEEEMHKAASWLIKNRIANLCSIKKGNKPGLKLFDRLSMRHCINVLSPFVNLKERNQLIEWSEMSTAEVLNNPLLSDKKKAKRLREDKYIRKRLNSDNELFLNSASDVLVRDSNSMYSILYYLSLLTSMAAFYLTSENYTYNWGLSALWIIPMVLLVVLLANFIVPIASWKKQILMKRIGL